MLEATKALTLELSGMANLTRLWHVRSDDGVDPWRNIQGAPGPPTSRHLADECKLLENSQHNVTS